MNLKRLGLILTVVAAVLVLVTTYLAIFFAPLPATSVKSADEVLASVEGSQIRISGFVVDVSDTNAWIAQPPGTVKFALADFSDYQRYVQAVAHGNATGTWWTVQPIDVGLVVSGNNPQITQDTLRNGTNVSMLGRVVDSVIGQYSEITGMSLRVSSTNDVDIGPPGKFSVMTAPVAQKIFYFHMPSAWVSYVAFFLTLVGSILYLRTKDAKFDRFAMSSAELGVLFATIAIATGPIWAKQEWGVYWRWDDTKLVTTFIMWLVYIGYLSLRAAMSEAGAKARVSAVYGIVGFVTMPMSLLSARVAPLLRSSHPEVIASSSGSLSPQAGMAIGVAVIAFTILFAAMLIKRMEIAETEEGLEELKREIGGEE